MPDAGLEMLAGQRLLAFAAALRRAGLRVEMPRVQLLIEAIEALSASTLSVLHLAGRLTLCSRETELPLYDACFARFFLQADPNEQTVEPDPETPPMLPGSAATMQRRSSENEEREFDIGATSPAELLRHRNLAGLSEEEKAQVHALIARMQGGVSLRPSRRHAPSRTGGLDMPRTARAAMARAGEPDRLHRRRPRAKPRRRVLLLDVSGSMSPYAGGLLRLAFAAHRSAPGHTEVFTIGTRLTRITPFLRTSDAEAAIVGASRAIPDWSGGTRLGDQLKAFLDIWGQRGMARRSIVVLASDGWERGETDLLGAQMQRLSRLANCIIWVNPHASTRGFEPLTRGMQAALPFVDHFVAGSTAAELDTLLALLAAPTASTIAALSVSGVSAGLRLGTPVTVVHKSDPAFSVRGC